MIYFLQYHVSILYLIPSAIRNILQPVFFTCKIGGVELFVQIVFILFHFYIFIPNSVNAWLNMSYFIFFPFMENESSLDMEIWNKWCRRATVLRLRNTPVSSYDGVTSLCRCSSVSEVKNVFVYVNGAQALVSSIFSIPLIITQGAQLGSGLKI